MMGLASLTLKYRGTRAPLQPETSILMGKREMIVGDIIGSVVVNATFVLGLGALIYPFKIENLLPYSISIFFTILSTLCFIIFSRTVEMISRKEAYFLVLIYIIFVLFQIRFAM